MYFCLSFLDLSMEYITSIIPSLSAPDVESVLVSMLGNRLRRCTNIEPAQIHHLLFTGMYEGSSCHKKTMWYIYEVYTSWSRDPDNVSMMTRCMLVRVRADLSDVIPANSNDLYTICTMLVQRRRRWADIVQMLYKCFVFAGIAWKH